MQTAILYYSLGGATRAFARAEAASRDAALFEIKPAKAYTPITAFLRGCPAALRQKCVPLDAAPNLSAYRQFVLMAPVWAGFPAPPFNSMVRLLPDGAAAEVLLVSSSGQTRCEEQVRTLLQQAGCSLTALRNIRSHQ